MDYASAIALLCIGFASGYLSRMMKKKPPRTDLRVINGFNLHNSQRKLIEK